MEKRRPGRRKRRRIAVIRLIGLLLVVVLIVAGTYSCALRKRRRLRAVDASEPEISVQLLDVNPYSRPGIELEQINGIVIHYTANPGSTAQNNRDYFNSLQYTQDNEVSSNFVIGLDGEIVQCIPTWEMAYASNERNVDTISIECCHPDESGEFTYETYASAVQLSAWLCLKYDLTAEDVIRHYDVTGKNCPKYYVENEEEWELFRENVREAIDRTLSEAG